MNAFEGNLIGKTIHHIKRVDGDDEYCYEWTWGLYIVMEDSPNLGLYLLASEDGMSIDISVKSESELLQESMVKNPEAVVVNDLKNADGLRNLIGETIEAFKLVELQAPEIKSEGFTILRGLYARAELETKRYMLTFSNQDSGLIVIRRRT